MNTNLSQVLAVNPEIISKTWQQAIDQMENKDNYIDYKSYEFEVLRILHRCLQTSNLKRSQMGTGWNNNYKFFLPRPTKGKPAVVPTALTTDEKMMIHHNLPFHMIESIAGIMSDPRPIVNVVPNSTTAEDLELAQKLQKIGEHLWGMWNMTEILLPLTVKYAEIYGMSFFKLFYNKAKNPEFGGDIDCIAIPVTNLHFNGAVTDAMDSDFFIWEQDMPRSFVETMFKDAYKIHDAASVGGEGGYDNSAFSQQSWNNPIGAMASNIQFESPTLLDPRIIDSPVHDIQGQPITTESKGKIKVYEFWMKDYSTVEECFTIKRKRQLRNPVTNEPLCHFGTTIPLWRWEEQKMYVDRYKYPNGNWRLIIVAGNKVLKDIPSPYKHGQAPFISYVNIDIGEAYGLSSIPYVQSMSDSIDELISRVLEAAFYTSNPAWKISTTVENFPKTLTNAAGAIITVPPGAEADRIAGPEMPQYLFGLIQLLTNAEREVFGVNETITGGRSGAKSGTAIEAMQEAAQIRIRMKMRRMEATLKRLGRMTLSMIKQFYEDSRVFRILGENSRPEIFDFSSKGMSGTWDMTLSVGASLPISRLQRFQQLIQLAQLGMVDQETVLRGADFKDWQEIVTRMQKAKQEAQQAQMVAGAIGEMQKAQTPVGQQPKDEAGRFLPSGRPAEDIGTAAGPEIAQFASGQGMEGVPTA